MKKLKLKLIDFQIDEILSRKQLKNIIGGSDASGCSTTCTCSDGVTRFPISYPNCNTTCEAVASTSVSCNGQTKTCSSYEHTPTCPEIT